MMLEHLGEPTAAAAIMRGIERGLSEPLARTRDLGGRASTAECGKIVAGAVD
jgi:tartrate dehydrogenase/decarboxylase/D-malate dehydrogenase